jgi:Asp-tRNA(Asn)/Glu-tRNA(Gln) amidotransferase A subunit family amidase
VPLALKDNIDTADFPTTAGTPALAAHRPKRNAPIVQRLLDAGAIVLGKTNLQELAYGPTNNNAAFGPARNPYDRLSWNGGQPMAAHCWRARLFISTTSSSTRNILGQRRRSWGTFAPCWQYR